MRRRTGVLVAAIVLPCLLVGLLVGLATGCGSAGQASPEKIGPRGVDELVIPTPDPDPDDFVAEVDNPWLPLEPGTVWTYEATGRAGETVEVRVEDDRRTVAGVECVVVHTAVVSPAAMVSGVRRFYAQDSDGNVWLFGEQPDLPADGARSWLAGEGDAEAGVAMLATPRVGDGYVQQRADEVSDLTTVAELDADRSVPAGTFAGLLVTDDTLSRGTGAADTVRRYYAQGVGLVEQESPVVDAGLGLVLVSVSTGPAD